MRQHTSRDHTATDHTITLGLLRGWLVRNDRRETVLVIGGARTVPGAVVLTVTAALRAGAGTLQASERHSTAIGVAVPESAVIGLPESPSGAVSRKAAGVLAGVLPGASAVVIGPGLIDADETLALLERLLAQVGGDANVVLNAYALGAFSRRPELAGGVAGRLALTSNTTEAAFLLGQKRDEISDYAQAADKIAGLYQAVVTLMGAIADPDGRVWVDESGHIGLATSGSGDVLAGLVGRFLARGAELPQASCWATYVHAVAGQWLIPRTGVTGRLARELVAEVPQVIAELTD